MEGSRCILFAAINIATSCESVLLFETPIPTKATCLGEAIIDSCKHRSQ